MKKIICYCLMICSLITLENCKENCKDQTDPDCKNYNPCFRKSETSAKFKIEELLGEFGGEQIWIESDTIKGAYQAHVRFTALQDADSFVWKIGSSTYHKKSFFLNDFPRDILISVTLVVINKNPNKNCFPADNGIDTAFKTIYVWPEEKVYDNNTCLFPNPMPIKGTYKGFYKSKPTLETIIKFYDTATFCFSTSSNQVQTNPYFINIPFSFSTPDSCEYRHSAIDNVPFAAILRSTNGVAVLKTKNQKGNRATLDALAILNKDRKKISIKLKWIDDHGSYNDEFNGIKIK